MTPSRTNLVIGDSDRNWLLLWSRIAGVPGVLPLTGGAKNVPIPSAPIAFEQLKDSVYYGRFELPADTKPGPYTLGGLPVTVAVAPPRKPAPVVPAGGPTAATVRARLAAGFNSVTLAAGEHLWDSPVAFPAFSELRMDGAVVRRVGTPDYNYRSIVPVGPHVTVRGGTWLYDQPGQVFHDEGSHAGLVVADVTFRRCNLGYGMTDVLVRDCTFAGGGAVVAPPGLYLRNLFTGPPCQGAFQYWGAPNGKTVALVDNVWDGTDRGLVLNSGGGPVNDLLLVGARFRDIDSTPNGCELIACEGANPFDRPLIMHTRATGCAGAIQPVGNRGSGSSRDGLVVDLTMDGGLGVMLLGEVHDWQFQSFELRRCGVWCDPGVTGVELSDGEVFDWSPTRGNQTFPNMDPTILRRAAAVTDMDGRNTLTRVRVAGTMAGCVDVIGFAGAVVPQPAAGGKLKP